jgi:glycosyltransferase involved in cell wall biosynthesis
MVKISVVIITFNEQKHIARCIRSVKAIADEVVVVDSGSTDSTQQIANEEGAKVVVNSFKGFTVQKNFAVAQASNDYILSLDADEYLSPELVESIRKAKQNWNADAFTMNRLNNYAGRWIKSCGWYPDRKIRMWDRRAGKWEGGLLHEVVNAAPGKKVDHLNGDLLHLAYENASQLIAKMQTYSDYYAQEHAYKKKVSPFGILMKTVGAFFKNYILKRGFTDGYEGLVISASNANGVFYKYSKLYELNNKLKTSLIITTYNRKDALELVLLSVTRQTELPDEVIVADDGSRQDTRAMIDRMRNDFPVPLIHVWQEDEGFRASGIRNKAMAKSAGDYIVMIDGDIVLHPQFIRDHKRAARKGRFIQGSRVLLSDPLTRESIQSKRTSFSIFTPGLGNRKNVIYSKMLAKLFSYNSAAVYRVRSANMSFWREDVLRVNGFNEDFVGWGREDSEFAVRMFNAGIVRLHLKFVAFGYHLYHQENSRQMLPENQKILDRAIMEKKARCDNGIQQHMVSH